MTRRTALACVLALSTRAADPAMAQPAMQQTTELAQLARLFQDMPARVEWFTAEFLNHVPLTQVTALIERLIRAYGPLQTVEQQAGSYTVRLLRADITAQVVLSPDGRIATLLLQPAVLTEGSIDTYANAIATLPGRTAVLVTTNGVVRAAHQASLPLAVGSAFKLAVLHATAAACDAGRLGWDDVVRLDPAWRSVPTGLLQDWPDGTPLTVATLANLMISRSDNTAADALIHLVGRATLGRMSPRNVPFLTTRELFTLKGHDNEDLRREWAEGSQTAQAALLARSTARPLPQAFVSAPAIEWFFTAEELCAALQATAHLPPFRINPGPVAATAWASVAYKSGSETGVLNLSALVVAKDGRRHCVIATWNSTEPLDDQRLLEPFRAILGVLARQG